MHRVSKDSNQCVNSDIHCPCDNCWLYPVDVWVFYNCHVSNRKLLQRHQIFIIVIVIVDTSNTCSPMTKRNPQKKKRVRDCNLFYSLVYFRGRGGVGKRGKELFLPYKLFFLWRHPSVPLRMARGVGMGWGLL